MTGGLSMEKYMLDIDTILNKGMLPVVRKRDILRARVLSREEKRNLERGAPDIEAVSPSGQKVILSRSELLSKYTYLDGKKISMAGWSSSKEYIIARLDNSQGLAMMVPTNCTATVNGRTANAKNRKHGDYIVCLLDEGGAIDHSTIGIMPASIFRKMYYMPPNDVITKNLNSKSGSEYYPDKTTNTHSSVENTPQNKTPNFAGALNMNDMDFGDSDMYAQPQKKPAPTNMRMAQQKNNDQVSQSSKPTESKYTASARLVNEMGKTVGFIISAKNGKTMNITNQQMMSLCERHLVGNIKISYRSDTGSKYLSGNNIRIDTLPTYPAPMN